MFCWHFQNNLRKMQRVLYPACLTHLGLENRKKGLQFCFQISLNVLHVDGMYLFDVYYCAKTIFTSLLHYNYVNCCFCLTASY